MNSQDLRNLLEKTDGKFALFTDEQVLNQYKLLANELSTLMNTFLSDEEILKLFAPSNLHLFANYEPQKIISNLSDNVKIKILSDIDLVTNKLHLSNFYIAELAKGLSNEDYKKKIIQIYKLQSSLKVPIITTFNINSKLELLLSETDLGKYDKINILTSFDVESLNRFLLEHRDFCVDSNIHIYEIVKKLDSKRQSDFVSNLSLLNLTPTEEKEILATLKPDVKRSINTTNLPEEYKIALSMQYNWQLVLDLERNLEDYRDLDNLIRINPDEIKENQKDQFIKLCGICPNSQIVNKIDNALEVTSTAHEYIEAEEWIASIIDNLNPEYSKAQKIAVIDNAVGKKISYCPNFNTEVYSDQDNRALWKIIASGYGVCNGIANVEHYIFNKIGIESEIISGVKHTFLKFKDIELPLANGEIAKGNTILDPTWNLTNHRFGAKPDNFFISYEQARKNDIDTKSKDHFCHKNDELLQDATLGLDDQSLRNLFTSVGLANKDGQFPVTALLEASKLLHETYMQQPKLNIEKQFMLLSKFCPEFATCQNSSMRILSTVLLKNKNLKFNKCVVNRVYNKTDKEKNPVLFVYINSDELGEIFYFADKDNGHFVELPPEEFTKQFECYQNDLKIYKRT